MAVTMPIRVRSRRAVNKPNSKHKASINGTTCRMDIGGVRIVGGSGIMPFVVIEMAEFTGVTPSAGVTGLVAMHVVGATTPPQATVTA